MRNIFNIFSFILLGFSLNAQNIQGTIVKSGPLEVTAYLKPTSSSMTQTSANAIVYNVGLRIQKGALVTAPTISLNSLIGGAISAIDIFTEGQYFRYEATVNGANIPGTILQNQEVPVFTATFGPTGAGKFVRLVNDEATNNAYFDFVIPGYFSAMHPSIRFYPGGNFDNSNVINSWVEAASPLPMIIKAFSVSKNSERSAKLNWSTTLEVNSDYFGIERSNDADNWESIGKVSAAGNSDVELKYEFIDSNLPLIRTNDQVFYYRLRLTDLDGQFKYSEVRGVNFGKSLSGLIAIYPNPTAERINVDISGMDLEAGKIDLSVFDMNGRRVIYKNIGGNGIELINVENLPASTYNVMVKQGESVFQQRVIKID